MSFDNEYVERLDQRLVDRLDRGSQTNDGAAPLYSLSAALQNQSLRAFILKANILVFGVVGFFDPICKVLETFYHNEMQAKISLRKVYLNSNLTSRNKARSKNPLLILPTAENKKEFNQIVTKGLRTGHPVWLVALPSQLDSHLFASFNCFFVPSRPKSELEFLSTVTPIMEDDINKLNSGKIKAIIATEIAIQNFGISDRLGTVIYIDRLDYEFAGLNRP